VPITNQDDKWAGQMRAAIAGDETAYRTLLTGLTPLIRTTARSAFARMSRHGADVEDVVQETLLAIHLKRHTWHTSQPLLPWVLAITRNKVVDALRRRGHRIDVPIENISEVLPGNEETAPFDDQEVTAMLNALQPKHRELVKMITLDGLTIRDVATRCGLTEGTVRVTLHRSLKAMAAYYRSKLA
jgi:RNA polymerase sigma-70 factor (ECF subfamily)